MATKRDAAKTEAVKTVERKVKRSVPEQKEATVYVGPRLPRGKLAQFSVFRGGNLPAHVQKLLDECPAMKFLLVPASKLAEARRKLNKSSSIEAAKFAEVRKHFYKGAN